MKILVCIFSAVLVMALNGAEISWTGEGGDNLWNTAANWSDGVVPSESDIVKPVQNTPIAIDLNGETKTVSQLDFSSAYHSSSKTYPTVELRNGTLILADGFLDTNKSNGYGVESGVLSENYTNPFDLKNATLKVCKHFQSGFARTKGYLFTVGDGSALILDKVNLYDKFEIIKVLPGGAAEFTFDKTVQKNDNSTTRSTWSNEGGIFSFPEGFIINRTATSGWGKRASFRIQQKSGTMNLGGDISLGNSSNEGGWAMGLFFQWSGGVVHATQDVKFNVDKKYQFGSSEEQRSFIEENSEVTAEVDVGKTMDMSVLEVRDGVTLVKKGEGALKLADCPHSLDLQGGAIEFTDSTRKALVSLNIGGGCSFEFSHADMTLEVLEDNKGVITIAQSGLAIQSLDPEAQLSGKFAFETAEFAEGDTIVSTPDARLRAKIKADAEVAFESHGFEILEEGENLKIGATAFVFDSSTITDINDPAGWMNGLPAEGKNVIIAGEGVNAAISGALANAWGMITVQDGASLRIAAAGVALPEIKLKGNATLFVDADYSFSVLTVERINGAMPKLVVANGATLTVPAGYKFKNIHLVLCDGATLTESGDGSLVFGYADAGETAYFAMHATNATITALNSTKASNASRIDFASPTTGGRVEVIGDIVLKDCSITYNEKDGFSFGLNNPASMPFKVIADNTNLDFGHNTYVAGAANLVLTNNSVMFRRRRKQVNHDGQSENTYSLFVSEIAKITLVDGGELKASITDKSNLTNGVVDLSPDEDGVCGIEVLEGGIASWYKAYGNGKGVIRFNGGLSRIFCSWWWSWGNRSHVFNGLKGIDVEAGSVMNLCGNADLFDDNYHAISPFAIEAPFIGGGDVVITNTLMSKTFGPVLSCGDNTCTGTIFVASGDGVAPSKLYISSGANWAGKVVADGKVELVDPVTGTSVMHASPVAVSFGALDLKADFPVQVWRGEAGKLASDTLDVGRYLNNGGRLVPTMMTEGGEFVNGDKIVVGKIAKGAALPLVEKGWTAMARPIEGDEDFDLLSLRFGSGFMIFVK